MSNFKIQWDKAPRPPLFDALDCGIISPDIITFSFGMPKPLLRICY